MDNIRIVNRQWIMDERYSSRQEKMDNVKDGEYNEWTNETNDTLFIELIWWNEGEWQIMTWKWNRKNYGLNEYG